VNFVKEMSPNTSDITVIKSVLCVSKRSLESMRHDLGPNMTFHRARRINENLLRTANMCMLWWKGAGRTAHGGRIERGNLLLLWGLRLSGRVGQGGMITRHITHHPHS